MPGNHILGVLLIITGLILLFGGKFLGALPVIHYQGKHFSVCFPIGLCVLLSILYTFIIRFIKR